MRQSLAWILGLGVVVAGSAAAQTKPPSPPTDLYHVHFTKAAPGQAAALAKSLMEPDKSSAMPEHFIVLRHQEGDDWDYMVIQHLGPKTELSAATPAPPASVRNLSAWHDDTFAIGPSWAEFSRAMGVGGASQAGAVYVVGVHRPVPGHREQLEKALTAPRSSATIQTGDIVLQHMEGGAWSFATITRYNSWQDFSSDHAAALSSAAAPGGWSDIREHSAFHRDTITDRIYPSK